MARQARPRSAPSASRQANHHAGALLRHLPACMLSTLHTLHCPRCQTTSSSGRLRCNAAPPGTQRGGAARAAGAHHLVRQDAVDAVVIQMDEPVQALHLVLTQLAARDHAGLDLRGGGGATAGRGPVSRADEGTTEDLGRGAVQRPHVSGQ